MNLVHELAQWLAPWQKTFSDSKAIATAVISIHVLALLFGGGLAVAGDRAALRTPIGDHTGHARLKHELARTHRPVLIAIGILLLSGLALAAADVETYAVSMVFWVKMGVFVALLANGALLRRNGELLDGAEAAGNEQASRVIRRLRTTAMISLALWSTTLVLGTALSTYS